MTTPARPTGEIAPPVELEEPGPAESEPSASPSASEETPETPEAKRPTAPLRERASESPAESAAAEADRPRPVQALLDLLHDLAIAVVVCVVLITYVVQAFKVQGTSMSPELADGERILVNKLVYSFDEIERGDVVVFWYPEDPDLSFIKRVIGLPGETVEIRAGTVYVDGRRMDESYVSSANADRRSFPALTIRPGHYFVLGDNRSGSNDSRSWGLVPERYIYGKAVLRIWPLYDFGLVE